MKKYITLEHIETQARQRADQLGSSFVSSGSEIRDYVNASLHELYDLQIASFGGNYFTTSSLFTTDGTSELYDLPDDFYKMLGLDLQFVAGGNGYITLYPFEMQDRNRYTIPNFQSFFGVTNVRYMIQGNSLWLTPIASAGQVLRLHYVPQLVDVGPAKPTLDFSNVHLNDKIDLFGDVITCVAHEAHSSTLGHYNYTSGSTAAATANNFYNAVQASGSALTRQFAYTISGNTVYWQNPDSYAAQYNLPYYVSVAGCVGITCNVDDGVWTMKTDCLNGWNEYVIVDVAIKVMQKEESDVSVLMVQKQGLHERIKSMMENRDVGQPHHVSEATPRNGSSPWWPIGGYGGGFNW